MTCQSTERLRTARPAATADRGGTISTMYRRLRIRGFDEREAGNLTAYASGIAICPQPWTVRELAHLLFLREMNRVGRLWSNADDRVDGSDPTPVPARVDRGPGTIVWNRAGSAPESRHRDDPDPPDGRVTLLTLYRKAARPNATLDLHRPGALPGLDAAGDPHREAG